MSVGRNATYNLIGALLPLGLSLFTVPVYLSLVGPERYGVLAIGWLLLGYFGLFDFGLTRATTFAIASQKEATPAERAETFWSAFVTNLGLGVLGGLVLLLVANWFFANVFKVSDAVRPEILRGVPVLALAVPVATLTNMMLGALQAREKFLQTNTISVTTTALFQLLPLGIAWVYGPDLPRLLAAAVLARLLGAVIFYVNCHREIVRGQPFAIRIKRVGELLRYGGWVALTSIFGPVLSMADRFAIGSLVGAVAVTVYTVPFQLSQRIATFPAAITSALFPKVAAKGESDTEALGLKAVATISAIISPPVLVAILFVSPFFDLWIGTELGSQSSPVARVLLLAFWANAFALVQFMRLQATGRPDLVTKSIMIQAIPYLIGLYFMLGWFGVIGCAWLFMIRNLVDFGILSWFVDRHVRMIRFFLFPFGIMNLAILLCQRVAMTSLVWWAGAVVLLLLVAWHSWRVLPKDVAVQLAGMAVELRARLPFGARAGE